MEDPCKNQVLPKWALIILLLISIIAYPLIELIYQGETAQWMEHALQGRAVSV